MTTTPSTLGRHRATAWRWIRVAICALGVSTLVADGGLRQDEIDCEEAISYLDGCCPGFQGGTVACVHDSGCGTVTDTALSIEESQCIVAESCDQIVSSGICARVTNLPSPSIDTNDGTEVTHAPVCP